MKFSLRSCFVSFACFGVFLGASAGIAHAETVTICHRLPNGRSQILRVASPAVDAHLRLHPDYVVRTEVCDGVDNDCDDAVDEDLGTTTCGLGPCEHEVFNCVGGVPQVCDPLQGATTEICDDIDNDCDGTVDDDTVDGSTVAIGPGSSPAGYLPLSVFGVAPIGGMTDDTIVSFDVPAFVYGGATYTRLGVGSNGYLVVGGGSDADVDSVGQSFPDPVRPNNVLAPFWTDLNPEAAGAVRIATLTDGTSTWIVVDWDAVREFSQPKLASFEVWIGVNGVVDITYAYGTIQGSGDGGALSVGAENKCATSGQNTYFDGAGTLPTVGTELRVTTTP